MEPYRPKRKEYHPDSIGFQLQLEGYTDAQIESKMWLQWHLPPKKEEEAELEASSISSKTIV